MPTPDDDVESAPPLPLVQQPQAPAAAPPPPGPVPPPQQPRRSHRRTQPPDSEYYKVKDAEQYRDIPKPRSAAPSPQPEPPASSSDNPDLSVSGGDQTESEDELLIIPGQNFAHIATVCEAAALLSSESNPPDPTTWQEALESPNADEWLAAAQLRFQQLTDNKVWELVDRPPGKNIIKTKPIFRTKHNADGSIERRSVRIAAKGYSQEAGVDYKEIFSPVVSFESLRTIFTIVASEDYEVLDMVDYEAAFIQAPIDCENYCEQPERLSDGTGRVLRLLKSLEGTHQASRLFYLHLCKTLADLGFRKVVSMPSCFIMQKDGIKFLIPLYVDDKIIACTSRTHADKIIAELSKRHKLRHLGPVKYILGIQVHRDRDNRTIELSQETYIRNMLDEFGMASCTPRSTPLPEGTQLSRAQSPQNDEEREKMRDIPYLKGVGKLSYPAQTMRPDLAYPVNLVSRFSSNPGPAHWGAVKHIMKYCQATKDFKLVLGGSQTNRMILNAFSDAAHGDSKDDGKSTGGHCVFLGNSLISWSSKKQPVVAQSTMEAELIQANCAGRSIVHLRTALEELGYTQKEATQLLLDNTAAIQVSKDSEHHSRAKHIQLKWFWIRDAIANKEITIDHVPTSEMVADIFTKALGKIKHAKFAKMLGLKGKLLQNSS